MAEKMPQGQEQEGKGAEQLKALFEQIEPSMIELQEAVQSGDVQRIFEAIKKLRALIEQLRGLGNPQAEQAASQIEQQIAPIEQQLNSNAEG